MTNLISMVEHLGSKIPAILIIVGVLALLRREGVLAGNNPLIMGRHRTIPNRTMSKFIISHLLHFLIIEVILIF